MREVSTLFRPLRSTAPNCSVTFYNVSTFSRPVGSTVRHLTESCRQNISCRVMQSSSGNFQTGRPDRSARPVGHLLILRCRGFDWSDWSNCCLLQTDAIRPVDLTGRSWSSGLFCLVLSLHCFCLSFFCISFVLQQL